MNTRDGAYRELQKINKNHNLSFVELPREIYLSGYVFAHDTNIDIKK